MCGSTHVFFFFHSLTVNHASSLRESSMKGNDSELLDKYGGWKSGVSRLLVVQISVTHLLWMNLPLWKRVKSRAALQNYQTEGIICTQLEPYVWQIYKNQKLLVIVYLVEFMKSSVMSFHNGYNFFFFNWYSGEKPYQCQHCGMSFSQSANLKKHIRIHTGDKPYQCNLCPAAFAQGKWPWMITCPEWVLCDIYIDRYRYIDI